MGGDSAPPWPLVDSNNILLFNLVIWYTFNNTIIIYYKAIIIFYIPYALSVT